MYPIPKALRLRRTPNRRPRAGHPAHACSRERSRHARSRTEPRFWLQALGRNARSLEQVDHSEDKQSDLNEFERGRKKSRKAFRRDWGQSLGANGSTGAPLVLVNWYPVWPAKYTFDINAAPDCNNNYVIFPTNLAGATAGQASVVAYRNLYAGTGSPYCGVSVAWTGVDPFHQGAVGYTYVGQQVAAWIQANDPGPSTAALSPSTVRPLFAAPPPIGNTSPAPGAFTTLTGQALSSTTADT